MNQIEYPGTNIGYLLLSYTFFGTVYGFEACMYAWKQTFMLYFIIIILQILSHIIFCVFLLLMYMIVDKMRKYLTFVQKQGKL